MARAGIIGKPKPYQIFGTFAGLPFWPGSLTLLAAAPGIGKTSWLLRVVFEASVKGFPSALGCYEHTEEELKYRLQLQAEASVAGPHGMANAANVENLLAKGSEALLLALSDRDDTIRASEEILLQDCAFPEYGHAVLAVDYLQRVPVVGLTGVTPENERSGEAAAGLRKLARQHGWAVIAACSLRAEHFVNGHDLSALLGDERVSYEADRVLMIKRDGEVQTCGCVDLEVHTLKNRVGPAQVRRMVFWGERFYPTHHGDSAHS
ncbi:MAG: DnaB-like helicase C-terminal domain-containing protein [Anaerolineales bacterium]